MKFVLISPWKLSSFYEQQVSEFASRISKTHKLTQIFSPRKLKNSTEEESFVLNELAKFPQALVVCLDENGKQLNSAEFESQFFSQSKYSEIAFVFGGAFGHGEKLAAVNPRLLSLSSLTLPHELSYLLLLEQIYRGSCIFSHHPYHHAGVSPLAAQQDKRNQGGIFSKKNDK